MREVIVTIECEKFIENCSKRVQSKFDYLLEIITEQELISKNFVDKIVKTEFYELRIKTDDQIRIIIFSIEHPNFNESKKAILLNGFVKKSTKDYKKAVEAGKKLLEKYKTEI